ncbi:chitin deacetylase [Bradyrhizobium ottawaense]|uniref:polysaccharide deacetylase family protein n=1 Tax=Bradyrhizobium ottawaense TaxID=931866 RepID=UPI000BE8645D|nr:polysaccharide deacetylase family protein [Bradyrhizobium ottawaense]PDT63960.1 chitin deacetylase [Bradyrhizobium ottawaense]
MTQPYEQIARNVLTVTVNVHGSALELLTVSEARLVGRYSSGGYLENGIDRILDLFDRCDIKGTFFVPGHEAERNPNLIREISSEGHEIAANGYQFEEYANGDANEHDIIRKAHTILGDCLGKAPIGWRAPKGILCSDTIESLSQLGYVYDSSYIDDDFPYPLKLGKGTGIIEIPQNYVLIDEPLFSARVTDARVFKTWVEEFDGLRNAQAYACMTVHPRQDFGVARPSRINMLAELIGRVRHASPSFTVKTCGELATSISGGS